jgi:hypothetical protein
MFLSTGRCGTQWLAAALGRRPRLRVEHEPIGPLYAPRRHFRRYSDAHRVLEEPAVAKHLSMLDRETRPYVETGWPLFPALPHLAATLPDRLRVIHLTRHPVPTALSHLAHSSYAGSPRNDAFTRLATLGPEDPRVFQPRYATRWSRLTPYEKCLFWWTEVNLFALEFAERLPQIPLVRLRAEDLLSGDTRALERLVAFIGDSGDPSWLASRDTVVDRWHHHTDQELNPELIRAHPRTLELAAHLGYDPLAFNREALQRRYSGPPNPGLDRIGRFSPS